MKESNGSKPPFAVFEGWPFADGRWPKLTASQRPTVNVGLRGINLFYLPL
jgi:hypothetical protein